MLSTLKFVSGVFTNGIIVRFEGNNTVVYKLWCSEANEPNDTQSQLLTEPSCSVKRAY